MLLKFFEINVKSELVPVKVIKELSLVSTRNSMRGKLVDSPALLFLDSSLN